MPKRNEFIFPGESIYGDAKLFTSMFSFLGVRPRNGLSLELSLALQNRIGP